MLKTSPAVFAVGNQYQIMVETTSECLMSVKIGENTYFDESNGIMNSLSPLHRVSVPMQALDNAKEYTVCMRPIIERKPYFTKTQEPQEFAFAFRPIPQKNIRAYHIADAHNQIERPVKAAKAFGNIDLLILNGDVIDHSGNPEKFANIYEICSLLTSGAIPVIFSRGNHDMRGNFAERFADYTPNQHGNTYYTFRLGSIWGMLLDCGEDKVDTNSEYGFTVACHHFRERQTEYIKAVIADAEKEYAAPGVKTRLIISHNPFTQKLMAPFDIEEDIYREWASLLKEHVKPNLMVCGHTHKYGVSFVGGENDNYGQPCPVVIASEPQPDRFIGCGFIINGTQTDVVFTDSDGNTLSKETLDT
ncbi:MAG: metallophosphoesterase [Clostridia bacterium]|nr:metallophosphoesterase [Clostridia bacterium]